jgi:hypothetical protein
MGRAQNPRRGIVATGLIHIPQRPRRLTANERVRIVLEQANQGRYRTLILYLSKCPSGGGSDGGHTIVESINQSIHRFVVFDVSQRYRCHLPSAFIAVTETIYQG